MTRNMFRDEPIIVTKKAIDVLPRFHGIYCTIEDSKPFVNTIVARRWEDDGRISFMLDSFNFYFRRPDEDMNVVELTPQYTDIARIHADDAEFRKQQPMSDAEYARAWAT